MKYTLVERIGMGTQSRPARALWIEITTVQPPVKPATVEAREGLVD